MRIDFHTHSTASDGGLTPAALVDLAADAQVQVLALTDHDSVAGIAEARAQASKRGLDLIAGIEISCVDASRELHVLGLGIDPDASAMQSLIASQQQRRRERNQAIAARLAKLGISDALAEAEQLCSPPTIPSRVHFARVLIERGVVERMDRAFDIYLGEGAKAYVRTPFSPLAEAVGAINDAGGIAVLAHPLRYELSGKKLRLLVTRFAELGGRGLEVQSGPTNNTQQAQLTGLALSHGLALSQGSDFHQPTSWMPRPGVLAEGRDHLPTVKDLLALPTVASTPQ